VSSGPGKTVSHLQGLLALDVELINIESTLELQRLARLTEAQGRRAQVAIRVNPSRQRRAGFLTFGGRPTPFGVDEDTIGSVLAAADKMANVVVTGFHFHEVCNNLDAASHVAYVQWCLDWSAETAARYGIELRVVDVGGGIGIGPDDEPSFDLGVFAHKLQEVRSAGCQIVLEPGRYLVAEGGYYATEVTDVKQTLGKWFVVLRGGINHFLRPAVGDYAGAIGVVPMNRWNGAHTRPGVSDALVTVVGELCSPHDVLARDLAVEEIRAGDLVVFSKAGSYGWELALQGFLGHPPALRITLDPLDG